MKIIKHTLTIALLLSLNSACGNPDNTVADWRESTLALESSNPRPHNRGVFVCGELKDGDSSVLSHDSYPILEPISSDQPLKEFGQKLALRFLNSSSPQKESTEEIEYSSSNKHLYIDLENREINFIDESNSSTSTEFDRKALLDTMRSFVTQYTKELGSPEDYYIAKLIPGSANQYSNGTFTSEITYDGSIGSISRMFYQLPLLGGTGSARFNVASNNKIIKLKIKYIPTKPTQQSIAKTSILSPNQAITAADKILAAKYNNPQDQPTLQSCELGYLPNKLKGIPDILVPGYLFTYQNKHGKSIVVIPATTEKSITVKYDSLNNTAETPNNNN